MAIIWGTTYQDTGDAIEYRLGYEPTINNTSTTTTISIKLYLGAKAISGYYYDDASNTTRGYWGTKAMDPKSEGAKLEIPWSGWSEISTQAVQISMNGTWQTVSIGTATKTYTRTKTSLSQVFTATLDRFEDMAQYPAVTYSFTIPALNKLTVVYNSNGATKRVINGNEVTEAQLNNHTIDYFYGEYNGDGLNNGNNINALTPGIDPKAFYIERTGYELIRYWNTKADGNGNRVSWDIGYYSEDLAIALGTDISNSSQTITVYAEWEQVSNHIAYVKVNGEWKQGLLYTKTADGWKMVQNVCQKQSDGTWKGSI